jgi:hypothetical protein
MTEQQLHDLGVSSIALTIDHDVCDRPSHPQIHWVRFPPSLLDDSLGKANWKFGMETSVMRLMEVRELRRAHKVSVHRPYREAAIENECSCPLAGNDTLSQSDAFVLEDPRNQLILQVDRPVLIKLPMRILGGRVRSRAGSIGKMNHVGQSKELLSTI